MLILLCPQCGAENPLVSETCQICQASLTGVEPSAPQEMLGLDPTEGTELTGDASDLPDLLHSLKQESDEDSGLPDISQGDGEGDNLSDGPESPEESSPEWLDVIRQRAQTEDDAAGDLIRRVSAAQESLSGNDKDRQHDNFESWIQKLRDEARDEAAGGEEPSQEPEEGLPDSEAVAKSDWLKRVRKAQGKVERADEPDAAGRSLLDWLVALEEERTAEPSPEPDEPTQPVQLETDSVEMGVTQKTKIGQKPAQPATVPAVVLELSRAAHEQINLLTTTIADESAERIHMSPSQRTNRHWVTAILGLVLIVMVSLALFTGFGSGLPGRSLSPEARAVRTWAEGLPAGSNLLLVFDYHPGTASEMSVVAMPILKAVMAQPHNVSVISSTPAGSLLAEELLAGFKTDSGTTRVTQLGYLPGEVFGAFGVGVGLLSSTSSNVLPAPVASLSFPAVDGVVIISDRFESVQGWIEQLKTLTSETPIYLLTTAQAGPLLQPYVDSGQVAGLIAGMADSVGLAPEGESERRWRAYQVGTIVLIAGLGLGAASGLILRPVLSEEGEE